MADPHPVSPEWKVIEYSLVRGYLSVEQLEEARAKVAGSQVDGALLTLLVKKYFSRAHITELRAYYEEQKEVFLREAEEAAIEVMSISDILVRPPLEVEPKSGRFRTVPIEEALLGSSDEAPVPNRQTASKWSVSDMKDIGKNAPPPTPAPMPRAPRPMPGPAGDPYDIPVPDYDEPIVVDTSDAGPKKKRKKARRRSSRLAEASEAKSGPPWLIIGIAGGVLLVIAVVVFLAVG